MTMVIITFFCFFLLLSTLVLSDVGINYGRIANNLPPPEQVVQLLKSKGINKVKIYDVDVQILNAFAGSNISLIVCMPNQLLQQAAGDQKFVEKWVDNTISKHLPKTKIEGIAVGNEILDDKNTLPYLVNAMKNVHNALVKAKLDLPIKVSSPVSSSCFKTSFPPSAGAFKPELIETVLKPMLDMITKSGSYFSINLYPFFAYMANSKDINLNYALMNPNNGVVDNSTKMKYPNMIEAMLDATYAAMAAIGFKGVKVVITETGWPSAGDQNEIGANKQNAAAYNGNLMVKARSGSGTPVRPKDPLNVYLFALFNENLKPGATSERNYGLFYPSQEKVYDMPFTKGQGQSANSTTNHAPVPSPTTSPCPKVSTNATCPAEPPAPTTTPNPTQGQSWCVANPNIEVSKLQTALDYACGEGGADCRPIQQGGTCFEPNTLEAHASYAFNSYYQKQGHKGGSCYFGGAARVVNEHPKFGGNCQYPTGY